MKAIVSGLYAVTPDEPNTSALGHKVLQAVLGGARFVQYRNKAATSALRAEQAAALREICRAQGACLIINDHVELALKVDADGVHLGKGDGAISAARRALGPDKIVGMSCYNVLESAVHAQREGADYVAFGSFFASAVKPDAVHAPIELLRQAKPKLAVPVLAIGGITLDNAGSLVAAGADGTAVISALFDAPDVKRAAEGFCGIFGLKE